MEAKDDVQVIDEVTVDMATVERDDALKFAAGTIENLRYIEAVWREHRERHQDAPVRLVTQTINSLLGLVVFNPGPWGILKSSAARWWSIGRTCSRPGPTRCQAF